MSDALPPPAPPPPPPGNTGLAIAAATVILLAALSAGGYLLYLELQRMKNAKPEAPPEITSALNSLRTQLDQQRSDYATQLQTMQEQIAALKEQTAPADINATLAPVQEKLDAIAQQLQQAPAAEPPPPPPPIPESVAAPPIESPLVTATPVNSLRDYLALRHAVESGGPYAAELAILIPQLPDFYTPEITLLQQHAEFGIGGEEALQEEPAKPLRPWMETINRRLHGFVSIEPLPEQPPQVSADTRTEVMAALARIEAGLMENR